MKLTQCTFPEGQYLKSVQSKSQIYLHHTAGNSNPFNVFKDWANSSERIATCVVVGGKPTSNGNWTDGEIAQGFSSKYWAWHLGLKDALFREYKIPYINLDEISIGIEICNWGQLTLKNDTFYNYVNRVVDPEEVCILDTPHRGYKYYHAYTDAQIEAVRELLVLFGEKYGIPLEFNQDIFDVCPRALKGESGIFTHNSVRKDKVDISPQPKMIEMLRSL